MSFTMTATGTTPAAPGRIRQGSPQQESIWSGLLASDSHLGINALAGTGKSTVCREGMHRLRDWNSDIRCSYVAFNKSIASEFGEGLPPGATATTMHSAGFRALKNADPTIGEPSKNKAWDIAQSLKPGYSRQIRKVRGAAVKLANLCKGTLTGGDARSLRYGVSLNLLDRLCSAHGIDIRGMRHEVFDLVGPILAKCLEQASVVDFSDMIWLPVMLGLDFDPTDVLFVDEAQDLDPCQHALVTRMAGDGRLTMVGDPNQAIYAFRGADSASMDTLARKLAATARGLESYPLTMTRRCPTSHVEFAARIVSEFTALPESPLGVVHQDACPDDHLTPGVLALARTNAPLVSTAFRLVAAGIPVGIQGRDIGEGLARFVEDFEARDLADLARKVAEYRAAEVDRLSDLDNTDAEMEAVADRCGCIEAVMSGKDTPGAVASAIRAAFVDATPANAGRMVLLSSIHRAKGREADRVAILSPQDMPSRAAKTQEAYRQELNLIYVATTRSKRELAVCGPLPGPLQSHGGDDATSSVATAQ